MIFFEVFVRNETKYLKTLFFVFSQREYKNIVMTELRAQEIAFSSKLLHLCAGLGFESDLRLNSWVSAILRRFCLEYGKGTREGSST